MEALAIFFIQSIIGGITGNRADDLTTAAYARIVKRFKKSGIPQNHDIERAIRRSYLLATIAICSQILKTENKKLSWRAYFSSNEITKWLNKVIDGFKNELYELNKPNYIISSGIREIDSSIFISRKDTDNNQTYLKKALENELREEVTQKFGKIPDHIVYYFKSEEIELINSEYQTWYELLCAFFSEQLKTDPRLRSIFDAQVLADIKHVGLAIPMEKVEYRLNQIGEKALSAIEGIRKNVGLNTETVDRIESQLFEIQTLFKNNFNNKGHGGRFTVAEKYAGYETYRKQSIRINDLSSQPIFGREQLFKNIDDFIVNNNSGTILITAPAGYGKSLILASWLTLKKSQGLYIVSHFFSTESQSSLEGYSNLVRQILGYYKLEGEVLPNRSESLRDMLIGLVEKENPNKDQPLIIVIDGLDESDVPFQAISSTKLPEGVFIIASIRTSENFDIPEVFSSWKKNNINLSLQSLNREDLIQWLSHLSIDFQDIGTLADLCITKTNGLPLYIKFLFDEIKNTIFSSYDALENRISNIPLGFETYVREQFNILANYENIRNRRAFQELFSLLTVAVGPLGEKDIYSILNISSWDLYSLPWPIVRWLSIQEIQGSKTYKFIHPLLADVFSKILGSESNNIEKRLLSYCEDYKTHQSVFTLQYYIPQLLKVNRYQDAINLMVDDKEWMVAKRSKFKNDKSLLSDIEILIKFIQREENIDNWFQAIVQLSALNETIIKRASSFREIDVTILIYQGRIEEAHEIIDGQLTFDDKLRFNLSTFFALQNLKQNTIDVEDKILNLFSNPLHLEQNLENIAMVLRQTKDEYLDFAKKFAQFIYGIDISKLQANNRIHLYGLVHPYLNKSSQDNVSNLISELLNEDEINIDSDIVKSLARTGHTYIEQHLSELINSNSDDLLFMSDFSILLPGHQKALMLKIFNWMWEKQNLLSVETAPSVNIYMRLAFRLLEIGEKAPSCQIINYIIEQGKKGADIDYAIYFISIITEQDYFEEIFELLPFIKESPRKCVLQVEIACNAIHNGKEGPWPKMLSTAIEQIKNSEVLDEKDQSLVKILSTTIKVNKLNFDKSFGEEIIILVNSIASNSQKLSAIGFLIENGREDEAQKLIKNVENIENISFQDIGNFVELCYRFGLYNLGETYYKIYKSKQQKYELYSERRLSSLSKLSDNLKKLGNLDCADAILEYAYELAKLPSDNNHLRNTEWNLLAKSLVEKGWNQKAEQLLNDIFVPWDEYRLHEAQEILKYFQDTPLDKNNYSTQVGKMLHKAYLELCSSDRKSNIQLNQTIETLVMKFHDNILDELLSGSFEFLLLLINENILHDKILESIVIELFYNDEIKSIEHLISSFINASIANGYYDFAWEAIKNEDLEKYNYFKLKQVITNIDNLFSNIENFDFQKTIAITPYRSRAAFEKGIVIQNFYVSKYSNTNSILQKMFDSGPFSASSIYEDCNIVKYLHLAVKILAWEDPFMTKITEIISNPSFESKSNIISNNIGVLHIAPCHSIPNSIKALYFYLRGIKMYRAGDFQGSLVHFDKVIQYKSICASAAYLLSGNINFILQNYNNALKFYNLVTDSTMKDYSDAMVTRTLLLQGDDSFFKEKIEIFKETDLSFYYRVKSLKEMKSGNWKLALESCLMELELLNKFESVDNYALGLAYYCKSISYLSLKEDSFHSEAFEKLFYYFNEEKYFPNKCHLAFLISLIRPTTELPNKYSFDSMINKGFLCRLGYRGFRAYANSIVDIEVLKINHYENSDYLKDKIIDSMKKANNKKDLLISEGEDGLLLDETLILLRSTNMLGNDVFVYLKMSLGAFRKLRDAMINRLNFIPSDFGEVVSAGMGGPSYELFMELKFMYKMINIPKHQSSVWEIY